MQKTLPKLGKCAWVVMKNCSINMAKKVEKAIKKRAKLIDLSPYSPDL